MFDCNDSNLVVTHILTNAPNSTWIESLALKLSNGETVEFGDPYYEYKLEKHLKSITTIFSTYDDCINNIVLEFQDHTSKQLGWDSCKGRSEEKRFGKDEFLIGAEIEHGESMVLSITWLTRWRL